VLKYSPSGEYLALGSNDNFIYIMDARNGCALLTATQCAIQIQYGAILIYFLVAVMR
jgi:WD40 repeat protein